VISDANVISILYVFTSWERQLVVETCSQWLYNIIKNCCENGYYSTKTEIIKFKLPSKSYFHCLLTLVHWDIWEQFSPSINSIDNLMRHVKVDNIQITCHNHYTMSTYKSYIFNRLLLYLINIRQRMQFIGIS